MPRTMRDKPMLSARKYSGQNCFGRSRSETRIWSKKRVWVYVDHERLAGWIDAKIETGIAAQPEEVPRGQRQLFEFLGKFGLIPFQAEAARCTDIGSAVRFPFCIEIHDLGRVAFEPLKQDLRDGQHRKLAVARKESRTQG